MAGRQAAQLIEMLLGAMKKGASLDQIEAARRSAQSIVAPARSMPEPGAMPDVEGISPRKIVSGLLDPQGYGNVKLARPIEAYEPTVVETNRRLLERRPVTLADIQGGYILPLYGDRSGAHGMLTRVGDMDLQRGYLLEGGADFKRGPAYQDDRAVWASAPNITNSINLAMQRQAEEDLGKGIYGMTFTMAPKALDFASFTSRVAGDLAQQSYGKGVAKKFDSFLRKKDKMGDFPGLLSEDLDQYLLNATPDQRKAFMGVFDKSDTAKEIGVSPDITAAARYAVTDPTQRNIPAGFGGIGISKMDVERPFIDAPQSPHSTYRSQMRGEYVGGLQIPLEQEILLKKAFDNYYSPNYVRTDGTTGALDRSQATYAAKTQMPTQLVTQEMVDREGAILDAFIREGLLSK